MLHSNKDIIQVLLTYLVVSWCIFEVCKMSRGVWQPMVVDHGRPWLTMFDQWPWLTMVDHGQSVMKYPIGFWPCLTMVPNTVHGRPCSDHVIFIAKTWSTMVPDHGQNMVWPWSNMVWPCSGKQGNDKHSQNMVRICLQSKTWSFSWIKRCNRLWAFPYNSTSQFHKFWPKHIFQ